MKNFKDRCRSSENQALWAAVVSAGRGLITKNESKGDATGVEDDVAQKFLSKTLSEDKSSDVGTNSAVDVPAAIDLNDDLDLDDDLD